MGCISSHFTPLYQQDKDHAYGLILEHCVALMSQTNNNLILKTDGSPMDFIILNHNIATQTGHFQQNLPLPVPIVDAQPIDLQQIQQEKLNKMYDCLK